MNILESIKSTSDHFIIFKEPVKELDFQQQRHTFQIIEPQHGSFQEPITIK